MSKQLSPTFTHTLGLIEKFQLPLVTPPPAPAPATTESAAQDTQALPLLTVSSTTLKAHVTKLSLLAITSPFTHSAVGAVLHELNESALLSLVTAALLVTPAQYTKAFHSEILDLVKKVLRELGSLVREVQRVDQKKEQEKKNGKENDLSKSEKDAVTVATGRVWDACDAVFDVAQKGVVGFVMRRVEQWRDLVRDAVEEIEEWDPEDDSDEFMDELLGEDETLGKDEDSDAEYDEEETAALCEHKKVVLRFLKPVAQVYPAIINNRLKIAADAPLVSASCITKLESLMANLQAIPDHVDEAAGGLYEADFDRAVEYLQKLRKCAAKAVDLVMLPWGAVDDVPADKFTAWSKTWLKVIEEVSKTISEK